MLGHGVDFGVQLFLDLYDILLVLFSDEVDGEADLPEPAAAADPVQVDAALGGEVEVDDHVDGLHVDAASYQVGADEGLELALPEALEDPDPFVAAHVGVQALVLVLLLVELAREHLGPLVGAAEDDALVDDQRAVQHEDGPHLLPLVHQHVVVRQADEHQLVHQVDHLRPRHELLLEGLDPHREGRRIHQQGALGTEVVHDLLDVPLEISLQQPVGLVEHEELALVQEVLVSLDQVLEPPRRADHQVDVPLLDLSVVLLDHRAPNEKLDIDLGELGDLLREGLHLQRQLSRRNQHNACVGKAVPWMYLDVSSI